jgi:hypothetical protein
LHWLSELTGREQISLLIDIYVAHIQEQAKHLAAELGIILHFIPAGLTDQFQPLDRRVFGRLKSSVRSWFMRRPRDQRREKATKPEAVEVLIKCWTQLSESVVEEAWSVYSRDEIEEEAEQ